MLWHRDKWGEAKEGPPITIIVKGVSCVSEQSLVMKGGYSCVLLPFDACVLSNLLQTIVLKSRMIC